MTHLDLPSVVDLAPMDAPVIVVGDLHLSEDEPAVPAHFEAFLEGLEPGTTLVLLGDVFDAWAGRGQAKTAFAAQVLDGLRRATDRGVRLAFLGGNRDYLFEGAPGLAIDMWPEVVRTRWGERTVVLSHGDLLCTADVPYQRARRFFRAPAGFHLMRALPFWVMQRVARRARRISKTAQRTKSRVEVGLDYGEVRRWLEGYEADALVLGHVHTGVHQRLAGSPARDVYVLRDWQAFPNHVTFDGRTIRLARVP